MFEMIDAPAPGAQCPASDRETALGAIPPCCRPALACHSDDFPRG